MVLDDGKGSRLQRQWLCLPNLMAIHPIVTQIHQYSSRGQDYECGWTHKVTAFIGWKPWKLVITSNRQKDTRQMTSKVTRMYSLMNVGTQFHDNPPNHKNPHCWQKLQEWIIAESSSIEGDVELFKHKPTHCLISVYRQHLQVTT